MSNEIIRNKDAESNSVESEQKDPAARRSFIKTVVAGAVAAGAMGAVPLIAKAQEQETQFTNLTVAASRRFKICFNGKKPPVLEDIFRAIELAARESGCTRCGLIGLDYYLGCQDIIQPSETPFVITGEQQFAG